MDIDTLKFVVPASALKMETELNIGFCKEIQRGVWVKDGSYKNKFETVDWESCIEEVSFSPNPEDTILDISKCKNATGYDISHDCKDGAMDLTKCMAGMSISTIGFLEDILTIEKILFRTDLYIP